MVITLPKLNNQSFTIMTQRKINRSILVAIADVEDIHTKKQKKLYCFLIIKFYQSSIKVDEKGYGQEPILSNFIFEPRHEKPCFAIYEQQRRRSAFASAQSDHRRCYSLRR